MPIPSGLVRATLSGTLGSSEVWATSFWLDGYEEAEIDAAAAATVIAGGGGPAWTTAVSAAMSSGDAITAFDMYYYAGGTSATRHSHAAVTGRVGTGASPHPKQIALAVSLRSANSSRSGRGRMFFPATGIPMATTGLVSGTAHTGIASTLRDFFNTLRAGTVTPVVVSQTQSIARPVVSVDVDTVPDTIRARRARIVGTRTSYAVT